MFPPTFASLFKIVATVPDFQARVIAVAGLVAQILDDRVQRGLLHDTSAVPARTAKSGTQAGTSPHLHRLVRMTSPESQQAANHEKNTERHWKISPKKHRYILFYSLRKCRRLILFSSDDQIN